MATSAHFSIMRMLVDHLHPCYIVAGCVHEQKAHGGAVDRRGQQKCSVCNTHGPYLNIGTNLS